MGVIHFSIFTFLATLVPHYSANAGDGKSSTNFSYQFSVGGVFAPWVSVPPQSDNRSAFLVLPPCTQEITGDCILSVEYSSKGVNWRKGSFEKSIELIDLVWETDDFRAKYNDQENIEFAKRVPEIQFPAGSRTGIWKLSGAEHEGGDLYGVSVALNGILNPSVDKSTVSSSIDWSTQFFMQINPLIQVPLQSSEKKSTYSGAGGFGKANYKYIPRGADLFPAETKFRISIRLEETKNVIAGNPWLLGRLVDSRISLKDSGKFLDLAIEGSPVRLGSAQADFEKSQTSYEVVRAAKQAESLARWGNKNELEISYDGFISSSGTGSSTQDAGTLEAWELIDKSFDIKLLFEGDYWYVSSAGITQSDKVSFASCPGATSLRGLVTTNAVAGNPRPPTWDPKAKEMTYRVASTHLRKDGSLNLGTYELLMDENLAKCLWGNDVLTYRASISVTSLEGEKKVATSVFTRANGFLVFRVVGFTYSTSRISLKLTNSTSGTALSEETSNAQLPIGESKPTATNSMLPAKGKKVTIFCINGSKSKKVTALKPKCPKGYKQGK